jgi:HK97 family phage major capsid protein
MEPEEIKRLLEEQKKAWEDAKSYMATAEAEVKKYGAESVETKSALDKINKRLDDLETKLNRVPDGNTEKEENESRELERKAYDHFLRAGEARLAPEERKALVASDDTRGGYLAPMEQVNAIIRFSVEHSPLRELASVRTTSQRGVSIPKKLGVTAAAWVSEVGSRPDGQNTFGFGREEIVCHEMSAVVDISNQDLEDTSYNLEAELNQDAGEQFGVCEATAFVNGSGVGKPFGFLDSSQGCEVIKSGTNGGFDCDDLIDLMLALKEPYWNNAVWLFRRSTLSIIRKFKANGEYIWAPALDRSATATVGIVPTILGHPYRLCPDMPAVGTGALAVAIGDFKQGYQIVDRLSISVLRDPYTQATSGMVRFVFRKRVGGKVVLPEAIKVLNLSA